MEKKKTKVKTKSKKGKKKLRMPSIFTILFFLLAILALIGIVYGIKYLVINIKYKTYTDKMYDYGFEVLYDNEKASSNQSVTNKEAIKVVVGSLKNTINIDNIYYFSNTDISEDEKWYEYVTELGYNTTINKSDLNNKANEIDTVLLITNIVEKVLGKEIQLVNLNMSQSKLSKYSDNQIDTIKKAVSLGLIENKNSGLSESSLIKGKLNKWIITIVEKYSTVYYENEFLSEINGETEKGNLIVDNSRKPTNYEDYPYIVDNIPNEIYQYKFKDYSISKLQTPKEVYNYMKDLYMQTDEVETSYLNSILNVDYETITVKSFLDNIKSKVIYSINEDDVKEYVNYVKENKIKIEGNAEPLLPIMYYVDGEYIIRTKITFKVISSDTKYNLLFGDQENKITYNDKEYTIYVDYPMGMTFNSYSLLAKISCIAKNVIKSDNIILIEE